MRDVRARSGSGRARHAERLDDGAMRRVEEKRELVIGTSGDKIETKQWHLANLLTIPARLQTVSRRFSPFISIA